MRLPTFEEFFLAHGVMTQAPRVVRPFHREIFTACTQWTTGQLPNRARNLAICIPPRHGKTFIARDLVAWGLLCFPDSEWIYTSYSATLATNQTLAIKECCASDWYRKVAPYVGVQSGKGRQDYFTTSHGGHVYGVGTDGSLTGFGAGKKRKEFGGGIVIDDPLAAIDALTVRRERCNTWYSQVLYSRRNAAHTPVLLIMQRLHEQDLVGYVRERESDLWHVLEIPVMDEDGNMIWSQTFDADTARRMEALDPFAFNAQYMQRPTARGGNMIKTDWIQRYTSPPSVHTVLMVMDTALKVQERNDYSVLALYGFDGRNVYVLDVVRGKWEAPDLLDQAVLFMHTHRPRRPSAVSLRGVLIEDKASGTGLIQSLKRHHLVQDMPIIAVQRNRDKVSRVNDVLPYIRSGQLFVPDFSPWVDAYIGELAAFSPAMTHRNDDQVDVTVDALNEFLGTVGGVTQGMDLT